jgi:List-Bact-rpt repeat protein
MLRNFVSPDKAASLDGLAASMGQQGISWARLTFDQANDEKQPGSFNWYTLDTMVAALARHGVRGDASFVGTAGWAADPNAVAQCPWSRAYPADLGGWSDWVAAAARRYGPNGTFWTAHPELPQLPIHTWEIGNEANLKIFWCPGANPEQYAAVYSASANAIKAVDPSAQVIVAGLAPYRGTDGVDLKPSTFLDRMVAADPTLKSSIDAVAIHPYASTVDGILGYVYQFRLAMIGAGMRDTPMIANEFGWYTQGPVGALLATESQRTQLMGDAANRLWRTDCGISGIAPYSWVTMEQNPSNSEDWYGLADAVTGAPHPSGIAYGDQIRLALGQAAQPPPTDKITICSDNLAVSETGSGTITSSPSGLDCGQVCSTRFGVATTVTLTATPAAGYVFSGWTGCTPVSGNQCTVMLMSDQSVTANFVRVPQRTLAAQSTGSGRITSSPAGIDCGTACSEVVDDGTQVTLTAAAAAGYAFRGWTGCDSVSGSQCVVTANADRTVSANFVAQRTLTAQKTGSGQITSSPAGISCGSVCSQVLDDGTQVTLTAAAAAGYAFRGWTGCDSVSGNQCTVTANADRTVSANFVAQRTLTAQKNTSGLITSSPAGINCGSACTLVVDDGTRVTLTATPATGYALSGWTGCDSVSGSQCTVTMHANRTVGASYSRKKLARTSARTKRKHRKHRHRGSRRSLSFRP